MLNNRRRLIPLIAFALVGLFVLVACSPPGELSNSIGDTEAAEEASAEAVTKPQIGQSNPAEDVIETEVEVTESPDRQAEQIDSRPAGLRAATAGWNTNWTKKSIDFDELLSGGPPRDGIPSIDDPQFVSLEEAAAWLADNEPVIVLEIDGDARAYPLQVLTWHEIVNDVVADAPVAVTFCPLCNSAITFDRHLDGQVYEFGTSGLLRNSDLVMYDRTTESLWQQFTGEAIVGELTGAQLAFLPSSIISFADFRQAYPDGKVLSRETGFRRPYGENPYVGYDDIGRPPFAFRGVVDGRLAAMERVVTVDLGEIDVAYPLSMLSEAGVINDSQGEQELVVFHSDGTASALDARVIAQAEDVGATGVFDRSLNGQTLTFTQDGDTILDEQTGSTWNILGQAVDGPLAGQQLTPIVHGDHFWFAWAAFKPETVIYAG